MFKKNKIIVRSSIIIVFILPLYSNAVITITGIGVWFIGIYIRLIPIILGAGAVVFMIGVLRYIQAGDNAQLKASGRTFMLWGIGALVVLISIWGFVNLLANSISLDNSNIIAPTMRGLPN